MAVGDCERRRCPEAGESGGEWEVLLRCGEGEGSRDRAPGDPSGLCTTRCEWEGLEFRL